MTLKGIEDEDIWGGVDLGTGEKMPVAIGGNLRPATLLGAYKRGLLVEPITSEDHLDKQRQLFGKDLAEGRIARIPQGSEDPFRILWWLPTSRPVIPVDGIRLEKKTIRQLRRGRWTTTVDEAFAQVVDDCRRDREPRWITDEIMESLCELHELGWMHSLEVWEDGNLIAGLFGCALRRVFSVDSSFHRQPNASKIAFADLALRIRSGGLEMIDIQMPSAYTERLGAISLARSSYAALISDGRRGDLPGGINEVWRTIGGVQ